MIMTTITMITAILVDNNSNNGTKSLTYSAWVLSPNWRWQQWPWQQWWWQQGWWHQIIMTITVMTPIMTTTTVMTTTSKTTIMTITTVMTTTFSAWALSLSPSWRPTLSAIVRPSARSCSSWWRWRSRLCPEVVIPPCCLFSDYDWFYCYQSVFFVLKLNWENICGLGYIQWIISCSSLLAPKTKLASGFAVGRLVYGKPIALNMGRQGSGQCCAVFPIETES